MLRADPMPGRTPSWSQEINTTGRWCLSASRPATMPITPGCQPRSAKNEGGVFDGVELLLDLLGCGQLDAAFQGLPGGVELVDILGQLQCPLGPIGDQQLDGKLRLTESPGRIEPRGEREGDVFARQPLVSRPVALRPRPWRCRMSVATPSVGHLARLSRP